MQPLAVWICGKNLNPKQIIKLPPKVYFLSLSISVKTNCIHKVSFLNIMCWSTILHSEAEGPLFQEPVRASQLQISFRHFLLLSTGFLYHLYHNVHLNIFLPSQKRKKCHILCFKIILITMHFVLTWLLIDSVVIS